MSMAARVARLATRTTTASSPPCQKKCCTANDTKLNAVWPPNTRLNSSKLLTMTGSFCGPRSVRPMKATTVGTISGMTAAPSGALAGAGVRSRGSEAILPATRKDARMIAGAANACSTPKLTISACAFLPPLAQEPANQQHAAQEGSDVRQKCDAAGARLAGERAQELPREPQRQHDQRRYAHHLERHHNEHVRARIEHQVRTEHARHGAAGADHRHRRAHVGQRLRERRDRAADQIERCEAAGAHTVLDVVAEDPE